MKYDFDRYIERRAADSIKWHRYDRDVLPLWIADMDFVSAQPILDALHDRVDHGIFGYTRDKLIPGLHQVIRDRLERLYNWHVNIGDILFLSGVVVGFNLACHAIGDPGDDVLMQPPVYYPFLSAPGNAGKQAQYAQVQRAGDCYEIDFDAFERAITDRTGLFILCNPHNPIGRVYRPDELERMAEICLRHNVAICSDEIHCDLIYDGHQHLPIASLSPEIAQNTITLMAPSKTFNIPGLGCSFAIIQNPELRKHFLAATGGLVHGVNILGYTATLAAYQDGQEWLDQLLVYLQDNRDFLSQYVERDLPGIDMVKLEGTYLAWLDCRNTPIADQPAKFFLEQARVGLNEGTRFGPGGEGYVRLNLACPRSTLVGALERMQVAYERQIANNS
jgi:cystathionine beta-lyase